MNQEINIIGVKDLVLWTENPRDPIDTTGKDQDVVKKALDDKSRWNLVKLAKEMGPDYDLSELPTVVYHGSKPIVYDGNRRMILAKLKHGYIKVPGTEKLRIPEIPKEIPCNVCSESVALAHVWRKHSDSGSWLHLERDIFLHKFMKRPKSPFLVLEESTHLISSYPELNQRFVRDEIFTDEGLKQLGFVTKGGELHSVHNQKEANKILTDIAQKIVKKQINTRTNRRKALTVLEPDVLALIDRNRNKKLRPTAIHFKKAPRIKITVRQSRRVGRSDASLFGGPLYLKAGNVSNLYRDIADLYKFYLDNKSTLSASFPAIIRMSLRLLCESAASDRSKKIDEYLEAEFDAAKAQLSKDDKTTLANQNVRKETIVQLVQTGAHNYTSAANFVQTVAISLILGGILTRTHGKPRLT